MAREMLGLVRRLPVRRLIVASFMLSSAASIAQTTILKPYALALFLLASATVVVGLVLALSLSRPEERLRGVMLGVAATLIGGVLGSFLAGKFSP